METAEIARQKIREMARPVGFEPNSTGHKPMILLKAKQRRESLVRVDLTRGDPERVR